ncbi:alpha-1,2-fucosyltransferase [Patescibacteria group bacterium]|nr:alpha-1,2-fucosyltransferase [Patescibacteria group bacterium]MDE1946812.1 alpha-1,2-fucosyltransferase [Patescibacteria group bacterium]MDE2011150.1 alpha-1,2-fucosyltransferase [Patescibacteria group bacterium]MDE2233059.1 alpha-1,2-fucosyltransferase [Patescibacteria group bacterium]
MKIIRIEGGLGNQMFQYAFAHSLAASTGDEIALDLVGLITPNDAKREYRLKEVFGIEARLASAGESAVFQCGRAHPKVSFITHAIRPSSPAYISERFGSFDPFVFKVRGNAYFRGNWQSERYFASVQDEIRKAFSHFPPLSSTASDLQRMIDESSVSLHVRRGDYVTHRGAAEVIGAKSADYYKAALQKAADALGYPRIFAFSDDIAWVRSSLDLPTNTVYVSELDLKDWEEMRLMSLCRRHVISNSSFSWWGAWLDPRPDKIVIAPIPWFRDPRLENKDICPPTWIRIPANL